MLLAEVMDKEPTLVFLWAYFLGFGAIGFLLGRVRWWTSLGVAPFVGLMALAHLGELRDPVIGPAIVVEAGTQYVMQSYAAMAAGAVLPVLGIVIGLASRQPLRG